MIEKHEQHETLKALQTFLTITAVSRETGYCINTLRDLADRGVVNPLRTNNGVRLFTREDVGRLKARREQMAKRA